MNGPWAGGGRQPYVGRAKRLCYGWFRSILARCRSLRRLAIVGCLLSVAATAAERPTVGLALSGGGARGFAHIGVLEWLEANHIPVDFVAGTSMGGLIGAMYAGGMSPAEIRAFVSGLNWTSLLRDTPAYDTLGFRRKQDQRDFPTPLELGLRGGVSLPSGLLEGQKIGLLLSRLTLPLTGVRSFDDLPIPFRCVAVDLVTGQEEVFSSGSLVDALRATMAVPGAFSPVRVGDKVLTDGGLLNNVPTDVVKAMGADIVIAVDIGTPLAGRETLDNLVGTVTQSVAVMMLANVRENLQRADILVAPPLDGISALDFLSARTIADRGVQGAVAKAPILRALALNEADWDAYRQQRAARLAPFNEQVVVPDRLEVVGAERVSPQVFERLGEPFLDRPLDVDGLERELTRLYAEGYYAKLGYEAAPRGDDTALRLKVEEKRHGPPFLRFQIDFQGGSRDETRFTFRTRATGRGPTGYGSEWRADLGLGRRSGIRGEYYQPLGHTPVWLTPRAWWTTDREDQFVGDRREAEFRTREVGVGLDVGADLGTWGQVSGGLAWGRIDQETVLGQPVRAAVDEAFGYFRGRFLTDTRNAPVLARSGLWWDNEFRYYTGVLGGARDFSRLRSELRWSLPVGRREVLVAMADGGTTFGTAVPPYGEFTLGGLMALNAWPQGRFRGAQALHWGVGLLHEVSRLPLFFGRTIYAAGFYEGGGAFPQWDEARYYQSVSAGLVADTLLGPAWLGYSFGEGGAHQIQFSIGQLF